MDDPIRGFSVDEYAHLTQMVMFEVRNYLTNNAGYCELAKEQLDPSHPAFSHVTKALQEAEALRAVVAQFDREVRSRRMGKDQ